MVGKRIQNTVTFL